jgi:hypothetical protein
VDIGNQDDRGAAPFYRKMLHLSLKIAAPSAMPIAAAIFALSAVLLRSKRAAGTPSASRISTNLSWIKPPARLP